MAFQQSQKFEVFSMSMDNKNITDMLQSKVPFGLPTTRSVVKGMYTGKNSVPTINANHLSNLHMASEETSVGQSGSIMMP